MTNSSNEIKDYGADPIVVNINRFAKENRNFRTTLWTGEHLQATLMSIPIHGEIGLESHNNLDQLLKIEDGYALVIMGKDKDNLSFQYRVNADFAIVIPSGTYHNVINIGQKPLKLFSVYGPPAHPFGTIHKTKADADTEEHSN